MKKFNPILLAVVALVLSCTFACKKASDSPVDKYVELIDQATKKLEQIKNVDDIQNIQDIMADQKALDLEREYADYELTKSDKEKLKKSLDKLIHTAYDKTMEFSGFPPELVELKKNQVDMMVDAANLQIDNATTLGEIGHK